MAWYAWVAVLLGLWVVGAILGWDDGELLLLAAVGAWFIYRLHQRMNRLEAELKSAVEALRAQAPGQPQGTPAPADAGVEVNGTPPRPAPAAAARRVEATNEATPPGTVEAPGAAALPALDALPTLPAESPPRPALPPQSTPPVQGPAGLHEPDESSLQVTTSLGASVRAWLVGGNTIVRVAVLILFLGVAFLLRYAAEHTTVPIEFRLAGVVLAGAGLVALGRRLLATRRGYALSLQGAGVGMVYLTLFAAYRLYSLLPAGLTFALLALLAAATALLAVRQSALPLAVLGFGGAFLAPVLASTGQGSHVALFSYCLVLNLAIAWIAQRQAWKLLNLLGFFCTFSLAALWGATAYEPQHFWTTEPFLVAHFLLYLFIAVKYTERLLQAAPGEGRPLPVVDGGLLFGAPLVGFGLQAALLKDQPLALAASAAVMSALYLGVGRWLWRRAGHRMLLLVEGLLGLGIVFLALVAPLALGARWTATAWALQGAGVLWVALRQGRWWAAGLGVLLQFAAVMAFVAAPHARPQDALPLLNAAFFSALVLGLAALYSAALLRPHAASAQAVTSPAPPAAVKTVGQVLHFVLMALGVGLLYYHGSVEVDVPRWPAPARSLLLALWLGVVVVALEGVRDRLAWPELRWSTLGLLAFTGVTALAGLLDALGDSAFTGLDTLSAWEWPWSVAWLVLSAWVLRRLQADPPWSGAPDAPAATRSAQRLAGAAFGALGAWFAIVHGAALLHGLASPPALEGSGWAPSAAVLLPALIGLALVRRVQEGRFPAQPPSTAIEAAVLWPLAGLLAVWVLMVNATSSAGMAPLPTLPLLNPLDLAHGLVALYGVYVARLHGLQVQSSGRAADPSGRIAVAAALGAALGFWWLNGLLVRTLHHLAGTPMWWDGALDSALVQTGLTVLWTLCALVTMLGATRKAPARWAKRLWLVGAALLGVVVLKLFLVDLSNVGTLPRIVSFLAVGGLMLVIGYVAPMPPAAAEPPTTPKEPA